MNRKKSLLLLLSILSLASCQTNSDTFDTSRSDASMTTSTGEVDSSSATKSDEEQLVKSDTSDLPYVSSLSSLKKTDWKGKYIYYTEKNPKDTYVAFRKTFQLNSLPSKAILSMTGDSKITLYVNGKLAIVDGSVKRGATMVDSYYQEYDILSYLKVGTNVLAFELDYFGRDGNASVDSSRAGLLFDLDMDSMTVCSDTSVKVKRLTCYKNLSSLKDDYPYHEMNSYLAERDIYFDARESLGYWKEDYDDSSWEHALVVATPGYQPCGDTYYCDVPPFDFDEEISDMKLVSGTMNEVLTSDTTFTFSLPENMQFLPYFEVEGTQGKHIVFYTNTRTTQNLESFVDDYICADGTQSYLQHYWRSGYQFIMEVPSGVKVIKVGYIRTRYHSTKIGQFCCDEENLNTLFTKAGNTLDICMRDTYMDCPERERSPYTGDGANQIAETMYGLDSDGWKLAKKTYLALLGWVKTDNVIPSRSPSGTTNEIPMQNLAFLVTAYDYYLQSGDIDTMRKVYPIFVNYLKLWNMLDNGLVEYRDGSFPWVDWGENADSTLMENAWYAYALKRVKALGTDIGIITADEESFLQGRYDSIKNHLYSEFYVENVGFASLVEKDGVQTRHSIEDRGNALCVLAGLVKEEDYPLMKRVLTENTYASPYMERFVLEALCEMGYLDEARSRMLTRYDGMISKDISTLWESWSSDPVDGTINHGWAGGPLIVLSKYFAGIKSTKVGYSSYQVKPYAKFDSLQSQVETPNGILSYQMSKSNGVTTILLTGPKGEGSLVLDDAFGSTIKVNGNTIQGRTVSLTQGSYTITIS
jgi:alpha-L-rhamnosidase